MSIFVRYQIKFWVIITFDQMDFTWSQFLIIFHYFESLKKFHEVGFL